MKTWMKLTGILVCVAATAPAQLLTVPSDGSDGVLNLTSNTTIDLSQAVTGVWSNNNTANAGKGIYDSNKWAVVFKYQSVNIPAGITNKFKNHPSRAPVVWIVQSNVTIGGRLDLGGQLLFQSTTNAEPGPGGFRGGAQQASPMGIGGAYNAYATYASSYGNTRVMPLIGGSGMGENFGPNAAGGGGAILIAAGSTATVNGVIQSKGIAASTASSSGGGVRIIASALMGNGSIDVQPDGRIGLEVYTFGAVTTLPTTPKINPENPPSIWPAAGTPECRIVSVGGANVSSDPRADIINSPDAIVGGPVDVILQTQNFPTNGVVQVRVSPKSNPNFFFVNASVVSGSVISATWKATLTLTNGYSVLQARAYSP